MSRYTPFYCEENVWWLAQEPRFAARTRDVVFVSNEQRACAMLHQKAAHSARAPIVWDYHVVLAVYEERSVEVWDLDTTAGAPVEGSEWLRLSFSASLPETFAPRFRLVAADDFVASFSSDRSHMRTENGRFRVPPPPWPCILNGEPNLERFIGMATGDRDVVDLPALRQRWGEPT